MNRLKLSILISIIAFPLFTGIFKGEQNAQPMTLFPEITFSSSAEFQSENNSSRVEIVEQNDDVEVKFKLIEWILSKF